MAVPYSSARQKEFVALDDPSTKIFDEAFRVRRCQEGTILELAVVDPGRILLLPDIRETFEKFLQQPWSGKSQRRPLPIELQQAMSFRKRESRPVHILREVIDARGNIIHVENERRHLRVQVFEAINRVPVPNESLRPLWLLAELLRAEGKDGPAKLHPKTLGGAVQSLLRAISKGAAQFAKEKNIPVLHTNVPAAGSRFFSTEFVVNRDVGECPDGFVQCNAPLRRGTDFANSINLSAEKIVFSSEMLENLARAVNESAP